MKQPTLPARSLAVLACALAFTALLACSTRRDGAANVYTFSEGAFEVGETVGSSSLDARIDVQNAISVRREGRLFVQFDLYNANPRHTELEYTVEWFDATGLRVPYIELWSPLVLGAESVETIGLAAPTLDAVQARVQFRTPTEIN